MADPQHFVLQSGNRRKETLDRRTDVRMTPDGPSGTEAKARVVVDEAQKPLRVHRVDGREEAVEIHAVRGVSHCWLA